MKHLLCLKAVCAAQKWPPFVYGLVYAFYFDPTPYTLNYNVNTKSIWLNNLIESTFGFVLKQLDWGFKHHFSEK